MKTYTFPIYLFGVLFVAVASVFGVEYTTQLLLTLAQKRQARKAAKRDVDQVAQSEADPIITPLSDEHYQPAAS